MYLKILILRNKYTPWLFQSFSNAFFLLHHFLFLFTTGLDFLKCFGKFLISISSLSIGTIIPIEIWQNCDMGLKLLCTFRNIFFMV